MSAKIYQRILQLGVFASLGVIFLVFSNLLFPYISSKQLSFNILIELLLPFYLVLIWKFPDFRPRRSWLSWGLAAYLLVILISCFTGVDFNLSFWGDVERLLGFFHVFHFFLFYLYLITAFRNQSDWYWLLSAAVAVAAIEAVIVLRGAAIGTIGNTAYVSGYFLFNLYFAVLLLVQTAWRRQWPFYLAIILMLLAFFKADTSGAIIGLGVSLLVLLFLFGLLASKRKIRRFSLMLFLIGLLGSILLFSQYNQPWFKENKFLHDLSVNKATFQTRRLSWEGAARDFSRHPWLGTGFGNYAIIFDRQFDPSFFNYATTEVYFDRAHNNLIDIVSTTGVLGLVAYLSIFIAAALAWWRTLRRQGGYIKGGEEGRKIRALLILGALLVAYFIQNLAVFDSLATYMGLMIALAYLVFLSTTSTDDESEESLEDQQSDLPLYREFLVLGTLALIVISVAVVSNVRPWLMLNRILKGYSYVMNDQISLGFLSYHQALDMRTPLDRDARNTLVNLVISYPTIFTRLNAAGIQEYLTYIADQSEKNIQYNPEDSLTQMQAAQLYDIISRYYSGQPAIFKSYSDKALAAAEKALEASPRRIPVYFVLAQIQANRGDVEGAEESFKKALSLNPNYVETSCQLANFYFITKKESAITAYLDTCLDNHGTNVMPEVLEAQLEYYKKKEDNGRLLSAYRLLAGKGSDDPLLYVSLAQAELAAGNLEAALTAAVKAGDIDPSLRPAVQTFLNSLQASSSASQKP